MRVNGLSTGGLTQAKPEPEKGCGHNHSASRNRARRDALWLWPQPFSGSGFAWVRPPVLNPFTRIAVEMCAADGTLRAVGYEIEEAGALPRMVTQVRELTAPLRSLAVSR